METSNAAPMLGTLTADRWGKSYMRQDKPTNSAVRRMQVKAAEAAEAAQWLADHAAELAQPDIGEVVVVVDAATGEVAAPRWYDDEIIDGTWSNADDWDDDDGRLHDEALADAAQRARDAAEQTIADRLADPDLPGWGTTFDPDDCQWGFTRHTSPHTLPGAVSGRPQPKHLAR